MHSGDDVAQRSDEELMQGYIYGDVAAFEELFERYEGRIYGFFLCRTGSRERAEDLYQDLFLRIHRARASYDPERRFSPWLFQIARRLLIDDVRRSAARPEIRVADEGRRAVEPSLEPEQVASTREQLGGIFAQLSDLERRILVGSKLEGREYAELAGELGKSVAAIRKVASRAMQRLRLAELDTALSGGSI